MKSFEIYHFDKSIPHTLEDIAIHNQFFPDGVVTHYFLIKEIKGDDYEKTKPEHEISPDPF
jgi:hypothetical protein